jgi:leader peptidase (prepilin peptidase)/N-methyltransferase
LSSFDNIPLVSYLVLGGKCRSCGAPISVMYPLVELVTAGVFLAAYYLFGPSPLLIARLLFASAMIVLFVIDLQHRILPNIITLPGIIVGFVFSLFLPPGWFESLVGIVAGGGVLLLMAEMYYRLRKEEGLGMGDVKMLAMIGAFLGWKLMLVTLVLSSFLGSLIGIGMIVLKKGDMKYALPFGTFLAIGAIVASVSGDAIWRWYSGFY